MRHRRATVADCDLLAQMNWQLIADEGSQNTNTVAELADRMRAWLAGKYTAELFYHAGEVVAYALYFEQPGEIYLRHFFVVRHRRRQGLGRGAIQLLRSQIWTRGKRLTVEVLVSNREAVAFWRSVGYADYSLKLEIPRE